MVKNKRKEKRLTVSKTSEGTWQVKLGGELVGYRKTKYKGVYPAVFMYKSDASDFAEWFKGEKSSTKKVRIWTKTEKYI